MSARNPSDFTNLLDLSGLRAGSQILETLPDDWHNDLEYALDAEQLGIPDCFRLFRTQSTVYVTVATYNAILKDVCDVAGITNDETAAEWCAYVWSDGARDIELQLVSNATTNNTSTNTLAATTTPTWTTFGHSAFNVKTNGEETSLVLSMRRNAGGAEYVYCAGLGLYVLTT